MVSSELLPEIKPEEQPPTNNPNNKEKTDDTVTSDTLPKTGESSSIPYYITGIAAVIIGLFFRRKGNKTS
ncbi:LPXTG cell wall anchor domain-containing protein [Paenibacillus fonticola]|uniref:LPXTG cell wall anchor domain-containing protein n=1 Tax=Paenibacillus fonticola TaxID=379896 RepID=UPI003B8480CE